MEDFQALVTSLGESTVTYLGKDNLLRLDVFADEIDMTAHIEIFLRDDSWAEQSRAIDKMIELREMFIEDISIGYRFSACDTSTSEAAHARRSSFSMA